MGRDAFFKIPDREKPTKKRPDHGKTEKTEKEEELGKRVAGQKPWG